MQVTRESIAAMIEVMMKAARLNREKCGYSESKESFMPVAIIMGEDGEIRIAMTPHRSNEEKHAMMQAVADHASKVRSPLVMLVQDTRIAKPKEFAERYNLPGVEAGPEEYQRRYQEVLREHGGSLGNCHVSTWEEGLMVVSKSPVMPIQMRFLKYREGVGDTVVWLKEEVAEDGQGGQQLWLKMLPDWWDPAPATIN